MKTYRDTLVNKYGNEGVLYSKELKKHNTSGWFYDFNNNGKFDKWDEWQGKNDVNVFKYIVKPGDNLTKIAKNNNTDIATILLLNEINNPNNILIGQEIILSPSSSNVNKVLSWDNVLSNEDRLNKILLKQGNKALINTYYKENPTNTPYIIDDKNSGKLEVYINGKLLKLFTVVHGGNGRASNSLKLKFKYMAEHPELQDDYTKTFINKNNRLIDGAGNMSTPAGIFYTTLGGNYHGVPAFIRRDIDMVKDNNPNGIASSIHYGNISKGLISNGCTRISKDGAIKLSALLGGRQNVPTYILPTDKNNKFFVRNGVINFTGPRVGKGLLLNGVSKGYKTDITIRFDGKDLNNKSYGKDRIKVVNKFISGLIDNKQLLMSDLNINDDTYNNLSLAALGILGRESSYGNTNSSLGNFIRGLRKVVSKNNSSPDYISKYEGIFGVRANNDNNSVGLTQMRISQLDNTSKELFKKYNITKDDLVYSPEKAAIATMIKLALEYKNKV